MRRLIPELPPSALRVVGGYLAFAVLWIVASDALVAWISPNLSAMSAFQTAKGLAFVTGSGLLILWLLGRSTVRHNAATRAGAESDELLRLFVASIADHSLFMLDPEGRVASWNAGAARLKGYSVDEVRGTHFERFFTPEDRAAGRPAALLEAAQRDGHAVGTAWQLRKDGSRFWAETTLTALRDPEGRLRGFAKITHDLSEHRATMARQQTLGRQLAFAQAHGRIGFFEHDLLTDKVEFSERALEIYGMPRAQWVGVIDQWLKLVHPDDRLRMGAEVERGLRAGGQFEMDNRIIRPDGEERFIYTVVAVDQDENGRPLRTYGTILDVTERARARRAVDEHREQLAAIVESAMDAIITVDSEQRIVQFNAAAEHVFRIRQTDALGAALERFIPTDARARHHEHIARFGTSGVTSRSKGQAGMVRALRADGSEFPAEASIAKVVVGERRLYTVIIRDVTEREAARQKLEDSAARLQRMSLRLLQTQERERRQLARELHDELGQALTATKLRLQQVAAERPEVLAVSADLDRVLAQVRSMSLNLRPSMIDDLGVVATLRWYLGQQSQLGGFEATLDAEGLERRPDPDVESAAFRIVQEALTNVQRHACAKTVTVRLRGDGTRLQLEIHDDGGGFDPRAGFSSGGLLGMRERATLLGGSLDIESAAGHGTTVRAALPMRCGPDTEAVT